MFKFVDFVAYTLKDGTREYLDDSPLTEEQYDSVTSFLIATDYVIQAEEEISSYDEFEAHLQRVKEWDARLDDSVLDFEIFEFWADETGAWIGGSLNDIEQALNEFFQTFISVAPEEDAFNVEAQEYGLLLRELKEHEFEHLFDYDGFRSILREQVKKKYVVIDGWTNGRTMIYRFRQAS